MKKVSLIFGIILVALSIIGVAGFLPVNFWGYIIDLFVERKPGVFYKVVPTSGAEYHIGITFMVGMLLCIYGKIKKH